MARRVVDLDHREIGRWLKADPMLTRAIKVETEQVARNVRALGITVGAFRSGPRIDLPVTTGYTVTDRAHGSVTLAHPAGLAVQAKYGALTKAAARAGLEVSDRGTR